jgi:hypothetical protein
MKRRMSASAVRLARQIRAGADDCAHGPRPDDGRRPEQEHAVGRIVGGAGQRIV